MGICLPICLQAVWFRTIVIVSRGCDDTELQRFRGSINKKNCKRLQVNYTSVDEDVAHEFKYVCCRYSEQLLKMFVVQ